MVLSHTCPHFCLVCHNRKLSGVASAHIWSELHPIICVLTGEGHEASAGRGTVANLQVHDHLSPSSPSDYSATAKSDGKSTAARRAARPEHRSRRGSRFFHASADGYGPR